MELDAQIAALTDRWQVAIEAGDPDQAARFLAEDYALVILQPQPALVRPGGRRMARLAPPLDAALRRRGPARVGDPCACDVSRARPASA